MINWEPLTHYNAIGCFRAIESCSSKNNSARRNAKLFIVCAFSTKPRTKSLISFFRLFITNTITVNQYLLILTYIITSLRDGFARLGGAKASETFFQLKHCFVLLRVVVLKFTVLLQATSSTAFFCMLRASSNHTEKVLICMGWTKSILD